MFSFTVIGWVFFRSKSAGQAFYMLGNAGLSTSAETWSMADRLAFFSAPLLAVDWFGFLRERGLFQTWGPVPAWPRALAFSLALLWISVLGVREATEFIYFQF